MNLIGHQGIVLLWNIYVVLQYICTIYMYRTSVPTNICTHTYIHTDMCVIGEVFMCVWNPKNSSLATGSADGMSRLWELDGVRTSEAWRNGEAGVEFNIRYI